MLEPLCHPLLCIFGSVQDAQRSSPDVGNPDNACSEMSCGWQVPSFNLGGLSRQQLQHYGLLQACLLSSDGTEVVRVGIITEVYQEDSQLLRRFS